MSADNTSREALIERVAKAQLWAETNGLCDLDKTCDLCDCLLTSESAKTDGAQRRQTAAAVVDAVVLPLVEAYIAARTEMGLLEGDRDAAIARAEEAEIRLAVAQERRDHWRQRFNETAARAKALDAYLAASDDGPRP